MIDWSFWKDRTVFITGHTGFKGSWLSMLLAKAGAKVIGYALPPPTSPSLFEDARVAASMTSILGDVRNLESMAAAMTAHKPDIVIHMAAQPLVRQSYADPVGTFATNIMGTVHLSECVRRTPSVRAVVVVTSDKCYANKDWVWRYREDDPLGGHDPYSASKACVELVAGAYRDSFFTPNRVALATVRAGNVVGGGDWAADRLVPDTIRALVKHETIQIRNPSAVRPWQHVIEALRGYLRVAEALSKNEPNAIGAWNFGPDESGAMPVSWVVSNLTKHWNNETNDWVKDSATHPHEDRFLTLDSSKARVLLNWSPILTTAEALEWTVDWYRDLCNGRDARELTLNQIDRYTKRTEHSAPPGR